MTIRGRDAVAHNDVFSITKITRIICCFTKCATFIYKYIISYLSKNNHVIFKFQVKASLQVDFQITYLLPKSEYFYLINQEMNKTTSQMTLKSLGRQDVTLLGQSMSENNKLHKK